MRAKPTKRHGNVIQLALSAGTGKFKGRRIKPPQIPLSSATMPSPRKGRRLRRSPGGSGFFTKATSFRVRFWGIRWNGAKPPLAFVEQRLVADFECVFLSIRGHDRED
jgi:hypothetical protein